VILQERCWKSTCCSISSDGWWLVNQCLRKGSLGAREPINLKVHLLSCTQKIMLDYFVKL